MNEQERFDLSDEEVLFLATRGITFDPEQHECVIELGRFCVRTIEGGQFVAWLGEADEVDESDEPEDEDEE